MFFSPILPWGRRSPRDVRCKLLPGSGPLLDPCQRLFQDLFRGRLGWLLYRGRLYFGSCDSWFYCIDPKGGLVWKYQTGAPNPCSYSAIAKGLVLFGSWDTNFYALDSETGKLAWRFQTSLGYMSPVEVNPQIIDSTISLSEKVGKRLKVEMREDAREKEDYGTFSTSYLGSELNEMELDFRKYKTGKKYR